MPKYTYTAKSYDGKDKSGEAIAQDEKNLAQQLRSDGFLVTSITPFEEEHIGGIDASFFEKFQSVPLKEKMVFARNLSIMVASGLTVSRAVQNLALQTQNKFFKKILFDVWRYAKICS